MFGNCSIFGVSSQAVFALQSGVPMLQAPPVPILRLLSVAPSGERIPGRMRVVSRDGGGSTNDMM